jgi:hypothetical protein
MRHGFRDGIYFHLSVFQIFPSCEFFLFDKSLNFLNLISIYSDCRKLYSDCRKLYSDCRKPEWAIFFEAFLKEYET